MSVYERLARVQEKLKAPKGEYNAFLKFSYRSVEDILAAAKPLLAEYHLALTLTDDVRLVGDRYYVESTATVFSTTEKVKAGEFTDVDDTGFVRVSAWAREDESKAGLAGAQVTGAASSYARKYALNGMFAIDDTKDADSMDNRQGAAKRASAAPQGADELPKRKKYLASLLKKLELPEAVYGDFFQEAIGKNLPQSLGDINKAVKHAEVMLADEEERAQELKARV